MSNVKPRSRANTVKDTPCRSKGSQTRIRSDVKRSAKQSNLSRYVLTLPSARKIGPEEVFIYLDWCDDGRGLTAALPTITAATEYSFAGPGMFVHGHCMEARAGLRPRETFINVRSWMKSLSRIPFVQIIDLGRLKTDLVSEIERCRRFIPLAVFVLYCSESEYAKCLANLSPDWKIRLGRFFRFSKSTRDVKPRLRALLDAATATAINKIRNAEIHSAFISYSHTDKAFARWLYDRLEQRGIRCWLDEKELRAGDRIHSKVDRAIRERDRVLLCASKASLTSWWVDNELNSVIAKEQALWKKTKQEALVLIPLNLDGFMFSKSWKSGWKSQVTSRVAPDFSHWRIRNPSASKDALGSVIRALIVDKTTEGGPFK